MIHCSDTLKACLRDYDLDKLSTGDEVVVLRALQYGELADIKAIQTQYGRDHIIDILQKNYHCLDHKSLHFRANYFELTDLHPSCGLYEQLNTPVFRRRIG